LVQLELGDVACELVASQRGEIYLDVWPLRGVQHDEDAPLHDVAFYASDGFVFQGFSHHVSVCRADVLP